ncbi:MAG: biotin--[acetyl-CoA-carboxylase] ligase [Treponema sp.]|jgi:BirA family biotin operon repressor/biotin-[acetyl-CoA-carboxylase] ligase|nr:biotin--[acetyl-CoA-carboxylase] ligase [Treponema sp.]
MKRLTLHNPFGAPVYHENIVSSTMDVSRALAAEGSPHGTVAAADFQEAGRGRAGRSWDMNRGENLPFTILLRYSRAGEIPKALTLKTGLAVSLALEDFLPSLAGKVLVKWPNDIMIPASPQFDDSAAPGAGPAAVFRKAAGILAEARGGTVFVGVGINVSQRRFPGLPRDKATSLALAAGVAIAPESRFTLLEKILRRLYEELEAPPRRAEGPEGPEAEDARPESWHGRLEARLYKKGERVTFSEGAADSGRDIAGTLDGIGPGGELLLRLEGETEARPFVTGELRVYRNSRGQRHVG